MAVYHKSALFAVSKDNKTYLLNSISLNDEEKNEKNKWFTKLTGVKAQIVTIAEWDELLKQNPQCLELIEFVDKSWKINNIETR